jgi:hypothetical protein
MLLAFGSIELIARAFASDSAITVKIATETTPSRKTTDGFAL